jgi:hypothetical protein
MGLFYDGLWVPGRAIVLGGNRDDLFLSELAGEVTNGDLLFGELEVNHGGASLGRSDASRMPHSVILAFYQN